MRANHNLNSLASCLDFVSKRRCFLLFQSSFCSEGISSVSCLFGCYLAFYSVLRSLIKTKNFNGKGNENNSEYNGYVSVRYHCLFIFLPLATQGHKRTTWNSQILNIRENVNYATPIFFKFRFHILFEIFLIVLTNWMNLNSREIHGLNTNVIQCSFFLDYT